MTKFEHVFFPARMQPPHRGHIAIIRKILSDAKFTTILIYRDTNILTPDNPFSAEEVEIMLRKSLRTDEFKKCEIVIIPPFDTPEERFKWVEENTKFAHDSVVISDSNFLKNWYKNYYPNVEVVDSISYFGNSKVVNIRGFEYRKLIGEGKFEVWKNFAPLGVILYNKNHPLKDRIIQFEEKENKGFNILKKINEILNRKEK